MPRRNGVQRAAYEKKVAWLSGDWGHKIAVEKFGAALVASMPTYSRGPRKGKPKGAVTFVKCTEGGWARIGGHPVGGVMRPGSYDWALTLSPYQQHDHGRIAEWSWVARDVDPAARVRVLQTPEQAAELVKTYGDNPRYG